MDEHLKSVLAKKVERTMKHLTENNMLAVYVASKDEVLEKVTEFLKDGDTVSCGGSMTHFETGIISTLKSGRYNYLDRYEAGLTRDQIHEVFHKALSADVYITGTNAITEDGFLYNIDGTGNRVAAMIYGPKSVIVVAGVNKIVKNVEEAEERLRATASPANNIRLSTGNPCTKVGFCCDCKVPTRICADYVLMKHQGTKDRIKVILVGEPFGY